MEQFGLPAISPQNIVYWKNKKEKQDFYKNIIVIRNFSGLEYFELLNPEYKIIWNDDDYKLMQELCWSIETVDENPFSVLNSIPTKIKVSWLNKDWRKLSFELDWRNNNAEQELISYITHEIRHINWEIISDWKVISELTRWNERIYYQIHKAYPETQASFIDFDWKQYNIHMLTKNWIKDCCKKSFKESSIGFNFDMKYDFDILRSRIQKDWKQYRVSICKKCFDI